MMRFAVDCNAGRLARWLRALGHDASYERQVEDAELVRRALTEDRVLLTRDRDLTRRRVIQSGRLRAVLLRDDDLASQLRQVVLELGLPGLAGAAALMGWLLVGGYRSHRRIADPGLRQVSAALLAFVLWTLVYLTKGAEIDLDPINVYFWLFAGILLRLPLLQEEGRPQ